MARDLESVTIYNPTTENFSKRWNGELYSVLAGETKAYASPVSFHLAKHLSTKMMESEFPWKKKYANDQERERESVRFSQLMIFDNPKRRIALFKILRDVKAVEDVVAAYPFKGFLESEVAGTMEEYKDFVRKNGGTFETEPKGKPSMEVMEDRIAKLEKLLAEKEEKKTKKVTPVENKE